MTRTVTDLTPVPARTTRSASNAADIRGEVEKISASLDVVVDPIVRRELAEDLTAGAVVACTP